MALTESQKVQVRKYLGYPSLYANSFFVLNTYLDAISAEIQTEVESILARIVNVETAIDKAIKTAGLETVGTGDPGFYEGAKLSELRSLGMGFCNQLSLILGLKILFNPFGSGGFGAPSMGGFFG